MQTVAQVLPKSDPATIEALRETVARLERKPRPVTAAGTAARPDRPPAPAAGLRFGVDAIDGRLPNRCLASGLHEIAGLGRDREHATAPALLAASLFARHAPAAPILWVVERPDLFPPGLACCGLDTSRLIVAEAGSQTLAVIEEAARTRGLAGVVGEFSGRLDLTASRRIQLAAEAAGLPVLMLRRQRTASPGVCPLDMPNAAATRWRIACLPSQPAEPIEAGPFSLGVECALWRLELIRARGAPPSAWTVEAFDASGRLVVSSPSFDRPAAPPRHAPPDRAAPAWAAGHLVA